MVNDLTLGKVYKVYRIVNVNLIIIIIIIIKDDIEERVHLTLSFYQVVEEITDKEMELLRQRREMLKVIYIITNDIGVKTFEKIIYFSVSNFIGRMFK